MKRRRGAPAGRRPGPTPGPGPSLPRESRPRGSGRWRPIRIGLAIAITSAVVIAAPWFPRVRRPPADPLAGLSARAAADSITALLERRQNNAAVPYQRRLEREQIQPSANFEGRFAATLSNATFEVRTVDGVTMPATRSSAERVAFMREALERLDRADRLAIGDSQRGNVAVTRARMLSMWGFQREAYLEYRRAYDLRPLDAREHGEAVWLEGMLEDPTAAVGANPAEAGGAGQ